MIDRACRRDPAYRKKTTATGTYAVVTLPDGFGGRRDFVLGKYGTKESKAEYRRRLAEWEAAGYRITPEVSKADITVYELADAYLQHARQHYRRPDGTPTGEIGDYVLALRVLNRLYGPTVAKDFGPRALKAVRQSMVAGTWMNDKEKAEYQKHGKPIGWCRGVVNKQIARVRRVMKWAVGNELIPPAVLQGLQALDGLQRGRTEARETEPVKPVAVAWVEATLPHLVPTLADMVMLQLHSGARPGEVCRMRGIDIDTTGKVWLYRPGSDQGPAGQHKTAHRGHRRMIPLGPRAQEILKRHLKADVTAYLFSPREAMEEWRARLRSKRKSKVQPSQVERSRRRRMVQPGDHYITSSYGQAIRKAIIRANKAAAKEAAARGEPAPAPIPHWHVHQLRHTKGTEIRRAFGLDAARATLGHRSPVVTEVYAELDEQKAVEVALMLG